MTNNFNVKRTRRGEERSGDRGGGIVGGRGCKGGGKKGGGGGRGVQGKGHLRSGDRGGLREARKVAWPAEGGPLHASLR
jgi:hypothetical protein